ncbi:hypothetical protein ACIPL1_27845, partial [Pseudomonas sp. NPDC090202]|uniref:hypothetical protein n=1 Tax=Pseudomonas sp. NPDC090202 TaxID=3364476 RepID=UPI0038248522
MVMIQLEQDGAEVVDTARARIAAMANELRKIKARNLPGAHFDVAREKASMSGWLFALHEHGLLSERRYCELM